MLRAACGLALLLTAQGAASDPAGGAVDLAHDVAPLPAKRRYCIIGAGPSGLQLGQFMHHRGRDYITIEKRDRAGTFFDKYPRHRKLISINKRYTGRDNPNFNMRHDWNSLLESEVPQMTTRTKDRFPAADVLANYLREFGKGQEDAGRIVYNINVDRIDQVDGGGFQVHVTDNRTESAGQAVIECQVVVSAVGMGLTNIPPGLDYPGVIDYGDLPDAEETEAVFENKSVAVFGMGNAAMETSKALMPYVQFVHVFSGSKFKEYPLVSWEARYPGAIRATNAEIFDAYLLKSLDGGLADGNAGVYAAGVVTHRCGPGKAQLCLMNKEQVELQNGTRISVIVIPTFSTSDKFSVDFYQSIKKYIVSTRVGIRKDVEVDLRTAEGEMVTAGGHNSEAVESLALIEAITDDNIDTFVEVSRRQGRSYPLVYDHIIRCLGWRHDMSMFGPDSEMHPQLQPNGKFPSLTAAQESVNVKDLYFAGTSSHGRDHKRAGGGFIHGMRYTTRALFTHLEQQYEKQLWPQKAFTISKDTLDHDVRELGAQMLHRINYADGPYPMTHIIGDGMLMKCGEGASVEIEYHYNVVLAAFHAKYENQPRMAWSFGYGDGQRRSLKDSVTKGNLYEVFLWFYTGDTDAGGYRDKQLARLLEALHVNWDTFNTRLAVAQFIKHKILIVDSKVCHSGILDNDAVGDLNLLPREREKGEWGAGETITWVYNKLPQPVELFCRQASKPSTRNATDVESDPLEPCGTVQPERGERFRHHDGDDFEARQGSTVIKRWTVDVSRGIVQDIFVGGMPAGSPGADTHPAVPPSAKYDWHREPIAAAATGTADEASCEEGGPVTSSTDPPAAKGATESAYGRRKRLREEARLKQGDE